MGILYLIAVLPIALWAVSLLFNKQITLIEGAIGAAVSFVLAFLIHMLALGFDMSLDKETWSGRVVDATYIPAWVEQYEESVKKKEYYTTMVNNKPKRTYRWVHSHWKTVTDNHPAQYSTRVSYGEISNSLRIDAGKYAELKKLFNNEQSERGDRSIFLHRNSHMKSGDPNDYRTVAGDIYVPVTTIQTFENRVIAAPNLFRYDEVPQDIGVFPWPNNENMWESDRLLGVARGAISIREWDKMNSRLGPTCFVNVIAIGFPVNSTISIAKWQEAEFKGGKKNDLVICYGGGKGAMEPGWVKCFGWTDSNLVKKNLETLFLTSKVNDQLIPAIEKEIRTNYKYKDFEKDFAYIQTDPSAWVYITYLLLLVLIQGILYFFFHYNDFAEMYRTHASTYKL